MHRQSYRFRNIYALIFTVFMTIVTSGCELIEPAIYAKRGGMSPQTEFATFRWSVDPDIARELAGGKPRGEATWARYWQTRYDLLRIELARGQPQCEQFIAYIHEARRAANLPLYDNGKAPSRAVYGDY